MPSFPKILSHKAESTHHENNGAAASTSHESSDKIECPFCPFQATPSEMTNHLFGLLHSEDMLIPHEYGKNPDGSFYCVSSYKEFTDSRFHKRSEFHGKHVSILQFHVDKYAGMLVLTRGEGPPDYKIRCAAMLCAGADAVRGWKCTVELKRRDQDGVPQSETKNCTVYDNLKAAVNGTVSIPPMFGHVQSDKVWMRCKVEEKFEKYFGYLARCEEQIFI